MKLLTIKQPWASLICLGIPATNKHLTNIFAEGELKKEATVSQMEIVQIYDNGGLDKADRHRY